MGKVENNMNSSKCYHRAKAEIDKRVYVFGLQEKVKEPGENLSRTRADLWENLGSPEGERANSHTERSQTQEWKPKPFAAVQDHVEATWLLRWSW